MELVMGVGPIGWLKISLYIVIFLNRVQICVHYSAFLRLWRVSYSPQEAMATMTALTTVIRITAGVTSDVNTVARIMRTAATMNAHSLVGRALIPGSSLVNCTKSMVATVAPP